MVRGWLRSGSVYVRANPARDVGDIPADRALAMGAVYVPWVDQIYLIGGVGSQIASATDAVWTTTPPCIADAESEVGLTCSTDRCIDGVCDSCTYLAGDVDKNCVLNVFDHFCILDAMAGDDHCSTCPQP